MSSCFHCAAALESPYRPYQNKGHPSMKGQRFYERLGGVNAIAMSQNAWTVDIWGRTQTIRKSARAGTAGSLGRYGRKENQRSRSSLVRSGS